ERDRDGSGPSEVDGEEVAVVGDEVARGCLLVVRNDLRGAEAIEPAMMGVRDETGPFRVDVELHRAHGASALEDLRQRNDGLTVGGGVHDVAAGVDPDTGPPDAHGATERVSPL